MTHLLHLTPAGAQYWTRTGQGWQPLTGEPDSSRPVWVVTDLAEESFADVETPRLYGRDRRDVIERQLGMRFPDTPYRRRLDFAHGDKLLDRLAPTRHTLFGIAPAERVNAELDAKNLSVAALCPTSLLLAHIGQRKRLPPDLFVVLPSAAGLRIVFLKNRIPVLTRLAAIPDQVASQAEEIIRTHRYLENMRTIARGVPPPPVLILGQAADFAAPLRAARLEVITPPASWNPAQTDWRLRLFELAIRKQPFGQLAPVARRTLYLSERLRKGTLLAAALSLVAGVAATGTNLQSIFSIEHDKQLDQAAAQSLNAQLAIVDQRIAAIGPAPDLMRRAVELNERELESAPALDQQLHQLGKVLEGEGQTRVSALEWHLLAADAKPCAKQMQAAPDATPPADAPADADATQAAQRKVELLYETVFPADITLRAKAQTLRTISARLAQLPGAALIQDPAKELAKGALRGGEQASESERSASWCLTLPGVTAHGPTTVANARITKP